MLSKQVNEMLQHNTTQHITT